MRNFALAYFLPIGDTTMAEFASKGVAGSGLGLGIAGTALGVLNSGLVNFLGGNGGRSNGNSNAGCVPMAPISICSENMPVDRYDLGKENEIVQLKMEKALLESNIYTDKKSLELYSYVDGRLRGIESQIAGQAVWNATQTGLISCMQSQIAALQGLTKIVVPADNVCPQPMAMYNSWAAPTSTAAAGA